VGSDGGGGVYELIDNRSQKLRLTGIHDLSIALFGLECHIKASSLRWGVFQRESILHCLLRRRFLQPLAEAIHPAAAQILLLLTRIHRMAVSARFHRLLLDGARDHKHRCTRRAGRFGVFVQFGVDGGFHRVKGLYGKRKKMQAKWYRSVLKENRQS